MSVSTEFLPQPAVTGNGASAVEVTVLMPCLNEAETLERCIVKAQRALTEGNLRGEIVIGDNGSTDGSQALATRLGARVIDIPVKGVRCRVAGRDRRRAW